MNLTLKATFVLAAMAATGCGGGHSGADGGAGGADGGPTGGGCAAVACSAPCTSTTTCPANLVCTNGYCSTPPPTSTNYTPCQLDADCPRGDHCALGVCTYDCQTDHDCSSGDVCDSRGYCTGVADAGSPPAIVAPAPITLVALPTQVDLGLSLSTSSVTLTNSGSTNIPFRAYSTKPWLTVSPASGSFGATQSLALTANRSLAQLADGGTDTQAQIRINSSAGSTSVLVQLTGTFTGRWLGTVNLSVGAQSDGSGGYPMATSTLAMDLTTSVSGAITGYVEPKSSLLFPYQSAVSGTISGDQVTLNFNVPTTPGSPQNPAGTLSVVRQVTLSGTLSSSTTWAGSYLEVGNGSSASLPSFVVGGTFSLQNVGAPISGQGVAPPAPTPAPTSPFSGAPYGVCRLEPANSGPSGPLDQARQDLMAAAQFYSDFANAASTTNWTPGPDPWDTTITGKCDGSGCVDTVELRCAEYWFEQALIQSPNSTPAIDGFFDAWQVSADYALLYGNNELVTGANAWLSGMSTYSSNNLTDPTNPLSAYGTAQAYFQDGSHTQDQTQPVAMLDPYFVSIGLTGAVPAQANSMAQSPLTSQTPSHIQSQLGAVAGQLQAADMLSDLQFRLQDAADVQAAQTTISLAAMQGYLDAAWLGMFLSAAQVPSNAYPQLATVSSTFQSLSNRFADINGGRNPSGYLPDYVFFLLASANTPSGQGDNYQQIYAFLQADPLATAVSDFGAAQAAVNFYEQGSSSYNNDVQSQVTGFENQIATICGPNVSPPSLLGCGAPGSTLYAALGDAQIAALRMQAAQNNIANLYQQIQIEQSRAQQVSQIYDAQAELITADGQQIQALDEARIQNDESSAVLGAFGSILGDFTSGNFEGIVGAVVSGVASGMASIGADREQKAKDQIGTVENAQVQYNEANMTLINSAATIQDDLLQQANLLLELSIASESLTQAVAKASGLYGQAEQLASEWQTFNPGTAEQAQDLLHARVFASNAALTAQTDMKALFAWTFLATRAYEYQHNVSYAPTTPLWTYLDPNDLKSGYLNDLNNEYVTTKPSSVQMNTDIISVRDQLLDMSQSVTDATTGHTYTPQERFQRFVSDPANRDANGNLSFQFLTYRPQAPTQIFSANVCDDMIFSLQGNLIGDDLGPLTYAYLTLQRSGTAYLRSCGTPTTPPAAPTEYNLTSTGASDLGASNAASVARVQVGVNAANNGTTICPAATPCANTDLTWQPVLTGPWTLTIDTTSNEPANQGLIVDGLTDITLVFNHYVNTIQ
jgi:hypothetical protein